MACVRLRSRAQTATRPIVALLLDAGVDANVTLAEGETALMTAARTGALDIVNLLVDHGADVNAVESWRGQTALMWAAAEGHAELLPPLLSHGADIGARSTRGWTALLFAAREGQIDAVGTLLEAGADIEETLPVEKYERRAGDECRTPINRIECAPDGHAQRTLRAWRITSGPRC